MNRSLSTFKIARLLDVNPSSVANWVDQGLLVAHRTPGGHRRIAEADLIRFLKDHKMPIPKELNASRVRILVVDDEPAVCQMIVRALQGANPAFEIVDAQDGFKAGHLVATLKPDVVILDLRMPGMDGFEVCKLIKGQEDTRKTSVLAITAFPSVENEQRIRECGADGFFPKPLNMDELLAAVNAMV
jgi:excisionase family DNA binding protein